MTEKLSKTLYCAGVDVTLMILSLALSRSRFKQLPVCDSFLGVEIRESSERTHC